MATVFLPADAGCQTTFIIYGPEKIGVMPSGHLRTGSQFGSVGGGHRLVCVGQTPVRRLRGTKVAIQSGGVCHFLRKAPILIFPKARLLFKSVKVAWRDITLGARAVEDRAATVRRVASFVDGFADGFRLRLLTQMDPARVLSLEAFGRFFATNGIKFDKVAVVSGSVTEPELLLLNQDFERFVLSYEDDPELFDLGKDWSGVKWKAHQETYDLVLCEQVLEHVVNPQRAVTNLALLLRPGGILHISVPSVNNRHGEPTYFYSGFAVETLEHWAREGGLEILETSAFSSDKGSRMYSTSDWAALAESGPVVFLAMGLRLLWRRPWKAMQLLRRRARNAVTYPFQPLFPVRETKNAVVSWLFARKAS
jgi:SAM-dependent methyltransferase